MKIKEKLHEYFTALVHYQYEVNNGVKGAEEAFKKQEEYLDEQFIDWLGGQLVITKD